MSKQQKQLQNKIHKELYSQFKKCWKLSKEDQLPIEVQKAWQNLVALWGSQESHKLDKLLEFLKNYIDRLSKQSEALADSNKIEASAGITAITQILLQISFKLLMLGGAY